MKIAITGIDSALGQNLTPRLQKDPEIEEIIGIDISPYQLDKTKLKFFQEDICNKSKMDEIIRDVDILIHLAFIVIPDKLPKRKDIYQINVEGSKNVFNSAAKNNVKKIIYTSSQSAYGHVPESPPIVTETDPLLGGKTTNFYYSHTKGLVEEYLDEFENRNPGISIIRFRPPIITGFHYPGLKDLIFDAKEKIRKSDPPINQNGMHRAQLIHEDDLADIIILSIKKDVKGAFNVASNIVPDVREFYEKEYGIKTVPSSRFIGNVMLKFSKIIPKVGWLQAMRYVSYLNTDKVQKTFNWTPKYTTEQCMKEMIDL